jgi:hypothetical protein
MISRSNRELEKPKVFLRVKPFDILELVEKIETEPGFSFARISDGGFFCILGRKGVNCDGAPYSPAQAQALIAMMKDQTITHGITSIALNVTKAAEWLAENELNVDWYDADVMNKASDDGRLLPFIECLRKRRSLIVGPLHLYKLDGFPIVSHVICHPTQAFEEVDELELEISFRIARDEPDVILLSAGQGASPTLVSKLHAAYPKLTVIDTGSLFDPYLHVFSRSGHKKRGWEEYKRLGWKNFQMDISAW